MRFRVLLLIFAFLVLGHAVFGSQEPDQIFFATDQATDFYIARLMQDGYFPLLGPPSHVGGRHPGPFYYWQFYALAWLADFDVPIFACLTAALKLSALFVIAWMLTQILPLGYLSALTAMLIAATNIFYISMFRTIWQSNFLIVPTTLAFAAAFLLVKYGWPLLPVFILGASLLLQSHVSSIPIIGGLGLAALLLLGLKRNFDPPPLSAVGLAALRCGALALCILLWLPVAIHDWQFHSNFGRLFNVHSSIHQQVAGWAQAVELFQQYVLRYSFHGSLHAWLKTPLTLLLLGALVAALPLRLPIASNRQWCLRMLVIPVLVLILAISRISPPVYMHYFNSSIFLPLLIAAALLGAAFTLWPERRGWRGLNAAKIIAVAALLLLYAASGVLTLQQLNDQRARGRQRPYHTLAHAEAVAELIRSQAADSSRVKIIPFLGAQHMLTSYYYFLGRAHFTELHYRSFFHELEPFQRPRPQRYQQAVAVMCPRPFRREQGRLIGRLKPIWALKKRLETNPADPALAPCAFYLLERPPRRRADRLLNPVDSALAALD